MANLTHHHYENGKPDRYYVNGKRVNRATYHNAQFWRRVDCFLTRWAGPGHFVHTCTASEA